MRQILILWRILILIAIGMPYWLAAQNCGLSDTLAIASNKSNTYTFEILDVVNNDLSDPNQGICAIEIDFAHNYVENLELWVTSPAGQMVQLIGPNSSDGLAFTFFARWDIAFVSCAATATPDSGYVARWDNNQPRNFVNGGRYMGSYYPFAGCLEDFNTGPINGTWTITTRNNPSTYPGAIVNFRIIPCDRRGFLCCFADAGSLANYSDLNVCEGDGSLLLSIPPEYPGLMPDTVEYAYTYLVSENGILLAYDSLSDLRNFPAGSYEVCGLSYKKADRGLFPPPDGMLTVDSLRRNLNSDLPIFCGRITNNCIGITINSPPDTVFLNEVICQGDSFQVGTSSFSTSGTYVIPLTSVGDCDSTVNLTLTVLPVVINDLTETICQGDSIMIGNSIYKTTGTYTDTLTAANGCDSIVNLNLTVQENITTDLMATICAGQSFAVGDSIFTQSGNYQVTLPSTEGCDSTVNLNLVVLEISAIIADAPPINCNNPVVLLDGSASASNGAITFSWANQFGNILGTASSLSVDAPGLYILTVNNAICSDSDTVTVTGNTTLPTADAGSPAVLTCEVEELTIGGNNTSIGANFLHTWQTDTGNFVTINDIPFPTINGGGTYTLVVTDLINNCKDTASVLIAIDTIAPIAEAGMPQTITCTQTTVTLDGSNSSTGVNFAYRWTDGAGNFVSNAAVVTTNIPGVYNLEVRDQSNGCVAFDSVTVLLENGTPTITFGNTEIPCDRDTIDLQGIVEPAAGNYSYSWTGPGIVGNNNIPTIQVNQVGTYILTVVNLDNNCVRSEFVQVTAQVCNICVQGIRPDTVSCLNPTVTLSASFCDVCTNCTIEWSTADGNILSGGNTLTPTVNSGGTYTITVRNSFGLSTSLDFDVPTKGAPAVADAGDDQLITCEALSVVIGGPNTPSGPDFEYRWTSASGAVAIPDDGRTAVATVADTFFLEVLDRITGCLSLDTVVVELDTVAPIAEAGLPQSLTCAQAELTLDGSGSSAGLDFEYLWTSQDGNIGLGAATLNPVVNATGTYTLTVRNIINGCTSSDSVLIGIDIETPPLPNDLSGLTLTCADSTLEVMIELPNPIDYNVRWCQLENNMPINCGNLPIYTIRTEGRYYFEIVSLLNGCSNELIFSVGEDRFVPQLDAGQTASVGCATAGVQLSATVDPPGDYSYQWSAQNGSPIQNRDELIPTVFQPDIYELILTNNTNGCNISDTVSVITDQDFPTAFAGADTLLTCATKEIQLAGNTSDPLSEVSISWSTPDGAVVSGANTLNPIINSQGTYILTITNNDNNCSAMDSITVGRNEFPPAAVVENAETLLLTCNTTTLILDGSSSISNTGAALDYFWTAISGAISGDPAMAAVQTNVEGMYQLIVTDQSNGCMDSLMLQIGKDVKGPDLAILSAENLTCTKTAATIQGSAFAAGASTAISWKDSNGATLADTTLTLQVSTPGTYLLLVTNLSNGCRDSISTRVELDTIAPMVLIAPPTALDCSNASTRLDASASSSGNYTWTTQDGVIVSGQDANIAVVAASGTYTLQVRDAQNGCINSADVTVSELEADIEAIFFTTTPPDCNLSNGMIRIDSVRGGTAPFVYALNGNAFVSNTAFSNLTSGNFTIRAQDTNGCELEIPVTVPEPESIRINLGRDTTINLGDSLTLIPIVIPNNYTSIRWSPEGSFLNSTAFSQNVKPSFTATYTVEVIDSNGCKASDFITIFVRRIAAVFVPNAFSPDGDGNNDVFMIQAGANVKEVKSFMIFDRWGNRVYMAGPFQPNDPTFGWDGNLDGKPMDAAVFVFFAEVELIDGKLEMIKGDLVLLR